MINDISRAKSWLASANVPGCDFPLQNLPFCAFESGDEQHLGVAIGDCVLDLHNLSASGLLDSIPEGVRDACEQPQLNALMNRGKKATTILRSALFDLLSEGASARSRELVRPLLRPSAEVRLRLPVHIRDYTDFYASIHHATNVGKLFRPDQPLLPNYKFVPIGYHGRASSIVVSGSPVRRPNGQRKLPNEDVPQFGPSGQLDYELELGAYIGIGNALGEPIPMSETEQHIFGVSLVNDWSARDIQAWEYQPLGPFLGKNFATTVSPFVVTMEALEPYRVELSPRAQGDPEPLPHLAGSERGGIDMTLEVYLSSERMREEGHSPVRLSRGNAQELYWSFAQMVAHHTSNGCNLQAGDLIASGTISGPEDGSQGSLLEITRRGAQKLRLPTGEERAFLEDGDEVTFRGFCEKESLPRIGLGECRGRVVPATLSSRAGAAVS